MSDRNDIRAPGTEPDDSRWIDAARRELDAGVGDLDAVTLGRLTRARQAELEAARGRRAPRWLGPAFAAGACAALALVAVLPIMRGNTEIAPPVPAAGADLELLAAADELELYEDLEFYAWLETQQPSGG
ncbi:MAG: DUF3619 domain-containing protein [Pseudomonadota bacterium]